MIILSIPPFKVTSLDGHPVQDPYNYNIKIPFLSSNFLKTTSPPSSYKTGQILDSMISLIN